MKVKRIATKLVACLLGISLLPLIAVAYLAYFNAQRNLETEVMNHLVTTADIKSKQIQAYFLERERNVTTLSRTPSIIRAMQKLGQAFKQAGIDSSEYELVDREVRPFLTYFRDSAGYHDLFLISPEGDAIFSVNQGKDLGSNYRTGPYKDAELAKVFDRAKTLLATDVSDFDEHPVTNEPAAFIAAPVISDGVVLGVVALQMSNRDVYAYAQDYVGLGETGEIVLGAKDGDGVVFLTPLRHDPQAALRRRAKFGTSLALPLQEAVQGIKGQGSSTDYRSTRVLAVWRYLPICRWGMVVKIDQAEAFASIVQLRNRSLVVGVVAISFVVVVASGVARSISKPIGKLTQSSQLITNGDLSHRVNITSEDEVGELASAFNTMVERLSQRTGELRVLNETLEHTVQKRTTELARSNHDLQQFANAASHDLQEPLRSVASFGKLLERKYKDRLDEKGGEYLQYVVAGTERMGAMINDLLAYSRVAIEEKPLEPTDSRAAVDEAVENLRARVVESEAVVIYDELPTVLADRSQLVLVFQNLIGNAIKYRSHRPPEICVRAESSPEAWQFSVKDNGIGIDPAYWDRIFEVFKRLHPHHIFEGTGIGLATCKRIVERLGGRIWVASKPGEGSTFFFTVPKRDQNETTGQSEATE